MVGHWIKDVQRLVGMDRDPSQGSAAQERSFWVNLDRQLKDVSKKRASAPVELTLEVLRHAKRFTATMK